MQLGSILILCGKSLIFWDGDFLQILNEFLDLSDGLAVEVCLAPTADSPSSWVNRERWQLSCQPPFPVSALPFLLKMKMEKRTEIASHLSFLTCT